MLEQMGKAAKQASWQLAVLSTAKKNQVLSVMADRLEAHSEAILLANEQDMAQARATGMSEALLDRLLLTPARLAAIANDVRQVCRLNDPVGHVLDGNLLDSGLKLERRRVPLGVIGVIYEARPNVTIDVASLCLKTGNAVILRGGKTPNYSAEHVAACEKQMLEAGLHPSLMIDCSHGNSNKDYRRQPAVAESVVEQIKAGNRSITGIMLESHLHEGNQSSEQPRADMRYGVSVTDACINWESTETLLRHMHQELGAALTARTGEK